MCLKLEKKTLNILEDNKIHKKDKIIIALSGGVDSMCLTHILIKNDFKPIICHINHGIRKESSLDEHFIKKFCLKNNLIHEIYKLRLTKKINKSFELEAREKRYEIFKKMAKKYQAKKILLAHHLDDSLETFFINLSRGSFLKGLGGIPQKRGIFFRPLMKFSKTEIINYAKKENVKYREDRTNLDLSLKRNFIRHKIVPLFLSLNKNFLTNFSDTQKIIRQTQIYLEKTAKKWLLKNAFDPQKGIINLLKFQKNPLIIKNEILKKIYKIYNGKKSYLSKKHLKRLIEDIKDGKKSKKIPFGEKHDLIIGENIKFIPKNSIFPKLKFNITRTKNRPKTLPDKNYLWIDAKKVKNELKQRYWENGDKFKPLGLKKNKKLQDFFVDKKIPKEKRQSIPILVDGENIVAIGNYAISHLYRLKPESNDFYKIKLTSLEPK